MPLDYTDDELVAINQALLPGGKGWDDDLVVGIRTKIKNYYLVGDFYQCCYCASIFNGVHRISIDVEHILPKGRFRSITFDELNVNVACKKCNLTSKGQKTDFVVDLVAMGTDYYRSEHYKFIHPNLDIYTDHLVIVTNRVGSKYLNKYVIKTQDKGAYTYNYFKLKDFEIDTFNRAQGISEKSVLSEKFSNYLRQSLLTVLSKL